MPYYYKCADGHISEVGTKIRVKSHDKAAPQCCARLCKQKIGEDERISERSLSRTKDDLWVKTKSRSFKRKYKPGVTIADIRNQNEKRKKDFDIRRGLFRNKGGGRPDDIFLKDMMKNNNARFITAKTLSGPTFCLCWHGLQTAGSRKLDILEITNPHWNSSRSDTSALKEHFDGCFTAINNAHSNQASTEVVGEAAAAIYMMSMKNYILRRGIAKGTGIDQIWQHKTSSAYYIVEAKGPGASITSDYRYFPQMSRDWVVHNLVRMTHSGTTSEKEIAKEIIKNCGIKYKTFGPGTYQIGYTATMDKEFNSYSVYVYDPGKSTAGTHRLYGWVVTAFWDASGLNGTKANVSGGNPYF